MRLFVLLGIAAALLNPSPTYSQPATRPAGEVVTDVIRFSKTHKPLEIKMVRIPAGEVEMPTTRLGGGTQKVAIKAMWMSQTEVTWEILNPYVWGLELTDLPPPQRARIIDAKLLPTKPYADPGYGHRIEGYPAMSVHPYLAKCYCEWLSKKTGKIYRLPTEAEWEYACRCGKPAEVIKDVKAYAKQLDATAWFEGNSANEVGDPVEHPAKGKRPNDWGLFDMLGNVGEWAIGEDGKPWLKGGSFIDKAGEVTSRARKPLDPDVMQQRDPQDPKNRDWLSDGRYVGFRIVREEERGEISAVGIWV